MKRLVLALAATLAFAAPANAAFINIDDTDLNNITITAGDFEEGFYVNGNLLTIGLGNSGSITLADGGYSISGSWIDLGQSGGKRVDILFALPGNPTFTTSGIEFAASTNGFLGTLSGSFGGYVDPSLYFFTALPTLPQDGQTGLGGVDFLSVSFTSENAVPEPATLLLVAPALALMRRRRKV